jgi:hypothetical protein
MNARFPEFLKLFSIFFQKNPKVPSTAAVTSFKMRRKPCITNPAVGTKNFKNISQKP